MHQRYTWLTGVREGVLILTGLMFCIPVYVVFSIAFRNRAEMLESPLGFPIPFRIGNLGDAVTQSGQTGATSLFEGLINSVVITAAALVLMVLLSAMTAYFIARTAGFWGTGLLTVLVMGLLLPNQLSTIPLFSLLRTLNLTGTKTGLVLLYISHSMPIATLLFTGFIRRMPKELEEAAMLDGASKLRTFFTVVFPLLRPVAITISVVVGINYWNDFFTPLILLQGSENATLPVALYSFVGQNQTNWPLVFSSVLIALAPVMVVYIFAQRYIAESLAGGVRG